jgi:hypothetical protein
MASTPAPLRFTYIFRATRRTDGTTCFLHAKANTERQARRQHEHFYELKLMSRSSNRCPRNIIFYGEVTA